MKILLLVRGGSMILTLLGRGSAQALGQPISASVLTEGILPLVLASFPNIEVTIVMLSTKDSNNLNAKDRKALIECVAKAPAEGYDAVIIGMGTDQLDEAAADVGFALNAAHPGKFPFPLNVFWCASIFPGDIIWGDAITSVARVFKAAEDCQRLGYLGHFLVFDRVILPAMRIVKVRPSDLDAFEAPLYDGHVVASVSASGEFWRFRRDFLDGQKRHKPKGERPELRVMSDFAPRGAIKVRTLWSDFDPDDLLDAHHSVKTKVIILRGTGVGNGCIEGNGDIRPVLLDITRPQGRRAKRSAVLLLPSSPNAWLDPVYEAGVELLRCGATPVWGTSPGATFRKAAWLAGNRRLGSPAMWDVPMRTPLAAECSTPPAELVRQWQLLRRHWRERPREQLLARRE